jgi:hypothetical protein
MAEGSDGAPGLNSRSANRVARAVMPKHAMNGE